MVFVSFRDNLINGLIFYLYKKNIFWSLKYLFIFLNELYVIKILKKGFGMFIWVISIG